MGLRVICNADDFGITQGACDAILECHLAGSVTSTSLMVNMPATEYGGELARRYPRLGVGLHFNITTCKPICAPSAVSSLLDQRGNFLTRTSLLVRAALGKIESADIGRELDAQIHRMRAAGLTPTHFDSHQHVHAIPIVFEEIARRARELSIPVRIPWRWKGQRSRMPIRRRLNEGALALMLARCVRRHGTGLPRNDAFCSVFDLTLPASEFTMDSYATLLEPYHDGIVELMVHPARVDDELRSLTEITEVSAAEYGLLNSSELASLVQSRGGSLVSYRDLT